MHAPPQAHTTDKQDLEMVILAGVYMLHMLRALMILPIIRSGHREKRQQCSEHREHSLIIS